MAKIIIQDDNGDIVFSKTITSAVKEVNIKTDNEEIKLSFEEKKILDKRYKKSASEVIEKYRSM